MSNIDKLHAEIAALHTETMGTLDHLSHEVALLQIYLDMFRSHVASIYAEIDAEATGRATVDSQVLPYQDAANVESDRPASSHGAR